MDAKSRQRKATHKARRGKALPPQSIFKEHRRKPRIVGVVGGGFGISGAMLANVMLARGLLK